MTRKDCLHILGCVAAIGYALTIVLTGILATIIAFTTKGNVTLGGMLLLAQPMIWWIATNFVIDFYKR